MENIGLTVQASSSNASGNSHCLPHVHSNNVTHQCFQPVYIIKQCYSKIFIQNNSEET